MFVFLKQSLAFSSYKNLATLVKTWVLGDVEMRKLKQQLVACRQPLLLWQHLVAHSKKNRESAPFSFDGTDS